MKSITVKNIATAAWDVAGTQTLNATLLIVKKQLAKSLQEYNVQPEQLSDFSNSLSAFIGYVISQKVHKRAINSRDISELITNGIVPSVASIAGNNPRGEEIIATISTYVGQINENAAFLTIFSQFAGNDIAEQLQLAVNSIAALNNPSSSEEELAQEQDSEVAEVLEAEEVVPNIPTVKEEMTDEEDEQFVNDVIGSLKLDFSSPEAAKDSFDKFVRVAGEVAKFSELQETKRTQIRADAKIAIKKVEAMRDVLKDYLAKSFDERNAIFLKQFEVVDKALSTGDNVMLSAGLTAINELAASSPFKALADINSVQQMLTDDSELDI